MHLPLVVQSLGTMPTFFFIFAFLLLLLLPPSMADHAAYHYISCFAWLSILSHANYPLISKEACLSPDHHCNLC